MVGGKNSLNLRRSARSCQLPGFIIVLGLIIAVTLLIALGSGRNPITEEKLNDQVSHSLESSVLPKPVVQLKNGIEVIWQIPTDPIAVLFIAHGCGGTALNFWDRGSTCPECVGLPEEKRIVLYALANGVGVLTITSSDNCWSAGSERERVKHIIRWWLEENNLVKVPLFGLGASAGGYFLSVLATEVRFRGVILMIASGLFDRMSTIPDDYPPTLFVHMPKDIRRARKIDRHIEMLRRKGIETQEIKCMEFPLTSNWLADRVSGLDLTTSSKLLKLFRDQSFIDDKGFLKNDGRVIPWREALKQSDILLTNRNKLMQHVAEELNLAYGYHEMTSLQSDQIFEWLKSHIT